MIVTSYRCDICRHSIEEGLVIHGAIEVIAKHYVITPILDKVQHVCLDCIGAAIEKITESDVATTGP